MALQSAFKERLADMENTRNQRLSLLQAEKDLQTNKSNLLSAKLSMIRSMEQQCLVLDHKLASRNFKISSLKSEIDFLDRKYLICAQQLRDLKVEVEEVEQLEKEREKCYSLKSSEMEEFKNASDKFAAEILSRVKELRCRRDELKLRCLEVENRKNPDIRAAEMRNSELLALKEKVAKNLESNYKLRAELQKQLQSLRMDSGGKNPVKKDNIPDSVKRKSNKVLGSAVKTIFTGKPPSNNHGGGNSSGNSSKVAPE